MVSRTLAVGVLAFLLAPAAGAPPPVPSKGIEIRGEIVGDGEKPVVQATVRILPQPSGAAARVQTGVDGSFVARGLAGAAFTLRVQAKGYAPLTRKQIPAGAIVAVSLTRGFTLSGIVRDLATGDPIADATVLAWEPDAVPFGEACYAKATTAKDGRFTIVDLPEGTVTVEARAPAHGPAKLDKVKVPPSAPAGKTPAPGLELVLAPRGTVTGRVTNTAGSPVAGADVTAVWHDGSERRSRQAKAAADGRYRIAGLGDAEVDLVIARASGYATAERPGAPPVDGIIDFVMQRGGSIAGRVEARDRTALGSFRVRVRREKDPDAQPAPSSEHEGERSFTDTAGAFRVDDLQPGTYDVEILADRHAPGTKKGIVVAAERVADLGAVILEAGMTLRGRVIDGTYGSPVSGASIRADLRIAPNARSGPEAAETGTAMSAGDGAFTIAGLEPGSFDLTVEHPSFSPLRTRVEVQTDPDAPELVVRMYRGGTLAGSVVDAQGQPVAGARIVVSEGATGELRTVETGPDGRYTLTPLTPGNYQVARQRGSGAPAIGSGAKVAEIREGETAFVDFDETPRVVLTGRLLRGDVPVPNRVIMLIAIEAAFPGEFKSTQSDDQGAFRIGLDHGGGYQASVRTGAPGTPGQSNVKLTIPDQPEVQQDIVLSLLSISGRVTGPDGNPVKGASITIRRDGTGKSDPPRYSSAQTGADGAYHVEGMDPGAYRVIARAVGFASAEFYPVILGDENPAATVDLTLERGFILRGRVVDPQGRGIPGAIVVVAPPGFAESGSLPTRSGPDGAFKITAATDGPVNVAAIPSEWAPAQVTNVMPPAEENAPELVLRASLGGALRIRVVRRDGSPAAGVQAALRADPLYPGWDYVADHNRPRPTGADGTTVVNLLLPGDYWVAVSGRSDVPTVRVTVGEGTETPALLQLP